MKRTGAEVGVADSARASSNASMSSWSIGGRRLESSAPEINNYFVKKNFICSDNSELFSRLAEEN